MSMYLDHFGLAEPPFRITPHTDFFFSGANRGETLEALIYAITQDEGIVKVLGEVGSGKTMLCRMLLEKLPASVETIYLANPSLSRDEIVFALADELEMTDLPERSSQLILKLQQHLIDLHAGGKRVVVLIDEAHAMPVESLEEVRLLSNLETRRNKLLQIVLFGQTELDTTLARQDMRPLRERVTHSFLLGPLPAAETRAYIDHRMRAAGYRGPNVFSDTALKRIAKASHGLTRRINILADKALLAAYAAGRHEVTDSEVRRAEEDARFGPLAGNSAPAGRPQHRWLAATLAVGLAGVGLGAWLAAPAPSPAAAASAATVPAAANPSHAPGAAAATGVGTSQPGIAEPPRPPSPSSAAHSANNLPAAALPSPPAATVTASTAPTAATTAPNTVAAAATPPSTAARAVPNPERSPATAAGNLTRHALAAYPDWLADAANDHYFVQMLRVPTTALADVERFMQRATGLLDPRELRAYTLDREDQHWIGIVYGDFPTRSAAAEAIRGLPETLRAGAPYPRRIGLLKE